MRRGLGFCGLALADPFDTALVAGDFAFARETDDERLRVFLGDTTTAVGAEALAGDFAFAREMDDERLRVFLGDCVGAAFSLLAGLVVGAIFCGAFLGAGFLGALVGPLVDRSSSASAGGHRPLRSTLLTDRREDLSGDALFTGGDASKSTMSFLTSAPAPSGAAHVFCDSLRPTHLISYTVTPFILSFLRLSLIHI